MASNHSTRSSSPEVARTIGFVGADGVGKTTVATLLASRLAERSAVETAGEVTAYVDGSDSQRDGLGIDWRIVDCPAGTDAVETERFDTVFVVATPDRLDTVGPYQQAIGNADCFLAVNRFNEQDRDRIRAFDGPEMAEYFYESDDIDRAMTEGTVPTLDGWTTEALAIETLQPDRLETQAALDALETGIRSIVNVEVADQTQRQSVAEQFQRQGYRIAYFRCNCQCHDGHVLARLPENNERAAIPAAVVETSPKQPTTQQP